MKKTLDVEFLRSLFDYDPVTGDLLRKVRRRKFAAGQVAGTVSYGGYRQIWISGKVYFAHRLIWAIVHGEWPMASLDVDHINGDPLDNRLENLRLATHRQNCANGKLAKNNTSGFKGVTRYRGRWVAQISRGDASGQPRRIGVFDTPEEAYGAYLTEARKAYGDFLREA